jgi:hypothetical protein
VFVVLSIIVETQSVYDTRVVNDCVNKRDVNALHGQLELYSGDLKKPFFAVCTLL